MLSRRSKYLLVAFVAICVQLRAHTGLTYSLTNTLCGTYGVYINETRKCYPPLSKGPCEELMVVETTDHKLGLGKCNCKSTGCGARPTIFIPEKNRCYYIFDQGPCVEGEWLVPSTEGIPTCETIPCPDQYNRQFKTADPVGDDVDDYSFLNSYVFPFENKCYNVGDFTHSPCPQGTAAYFFTPKLPHYCSVRFSCGGFASATPNRCPSDSEPDRYGGCEPAAEFE